MPELRLPPEPEVSDRPSVPRCSVCGRFIRLLDRLEAEASDWRMKREKRHYHVPKSHTPRE